MTDPRAHYLLVAALVVAALAALFDWRAGRIPNWLTYTALVLGPLAHAGLALKFDQSLDTAVQEGTFAFGGAALCAFVPLIVYRQGGMAAGDVKLMASIGAILQPMLGFEAQAYAFISLALLAPARLAYQGKLGSTFRNAFLILGNMFLPSSKQRTIEQSALTAFPLGPSVLVGVALTVYLHW